MNYTSNLETYIAKIINESQDFINHLKHNKNSFNVDDSEFFIDIKTNKLSCGKIDKYSMTQYLVLDKIYLIKIIFPDLKLKNKNAKLVSLIVNLKDYETYIHNHTTSVILSDLKNTFINQYKDLFKIKQNEDTGNKNSFFVINFSDLMRLNIPIDFINQYLGKIQIFLDDNSFNTTINYSFIQNINLKTFPEILNCDVTENNSDILFSDYMLKRYKFFNKIFSNKIRKKYSDMDFENLIKKFVFLNSKILNALKIQNDVSIPFEDQVSNDSEIIEHLFSLKDNSIELISTILSSEFKKLKINTKKDAMWFLNHTYFWQNMPKNKNVFVPIGNDNYRLFKSGFVFDNYCMKKI